MRKILFIAGLALASIAHAVTPQAVVCDGPTVATDPRTCTGGHYASHPLPTDMVRVGNGWGETTPQPTIPFVLKPFGTVTAVETIDACVSDIPEGSVSFKAPATWNAAGDACKQWQILPATSFVAGTPVEGVPAKLDVSWTLPTTDVAEKPLTGSNALTAIQLFVSTTPIPDDASVPTASFSGDMVQATYTGSIPTGSTLYARVRAVNASGASALSAQVSKLIELPDGVPDVVTNVQILLSITPKAK